MIYLTDQYNIHVVDGKTHLEKNITHIFSPFHYVPDFFWNIVVNPVTNMTYTSNPYDNTTTVIDGRTNHEIKSIPVGFEPFSLAVNSKTNSVYIFNSHDNTLSVITQANHNYRRSKVLNHRSDASSIIHTD